MLEEVTPREKLVLDLIRELAYGKIVVSVENKAIVNLKKEENIRPN